MSDDLRLVDARPGSGNDEGDGLFAHDRVGTADHSGLGHARVRLEHRFDLAGRDVLATADDEVLLAVDQHEVAVVVEVADVTGPQPAVLQRGGGLGRLVQVTAHDVRTSRDHLAVVPDGERPAVGVDDADLEPAEWLADRAGTTAVARVEGQRNRGLREAVALEDGDPVAALERSDGVGGHRRGATDGEPQ